MEVEVEVEVEGGGMYWRFGGGGKVCWRVRG